MIALLDPILCTFDYIRHRSSLLFTAILTVAAKFEQPGFYSKLLGLVNEHLAKVWIHGGARLEIIQAILLLFFFKQAQDSTSYRRIGFAIRMAYELNLDKPHMENRPLPSDEIAARQILSGERTWYELISSDELVSRQANKPQMISFESIPDSTQWLLGTGTYKLDFDPFISAKADVAGFISPALKFPVDGSKPSRSSFAQRGALIHSSKERFKRWSDKWITYSNATSSPLSRGQLNKDTLDQHPTAEASRILLHHFQRMCQFHVSFLLFQHIKYHPAYETLDVGKAEQAFLACFGSGLAIIEQLAEEMSQEGRLRYAQDYVWLGSATAALWLCSVRVGQFIQAKIFH